MRVAVIGSGAAGLAPTWLLNEYSDHEVHLYKADSRPGGHANTIRVHQPGKEPVDVDGAFLAFSKQMYPNFYQFLELHKRTGDLISTATTFGVSTNDGAIEWAGESFRHLICKPSSIFDLGMWRLVFDIARFNACVTRVLSEDGDPTIEAYVKREGHSAQFKDMFLVPMTAVLWSTPPDVTATDFPIKTLVSFLHNHDLLRIAGKAAWLTFRGGSKKYVDSILSRFPAERLHLSTPVHAVSSGKDNAILVTATGKRETFDHIIFACHSDDVLRILDAGSGATPEERDILSTFRWAKNDVWLHSDESLMPRMRQAWSSWNHIGRKAYNEKGIEKAFAPHLSSTYWLNDIQQVPEEEHGYIFMSLNPSSPPSAKHVLGHHTYMHPVQSPDALRAQTRLSQLNARATESGRHRAFAGAWTGDGFHEAGFTSGLRAAAALPGVAPPFRIVNADAECGVPRMGVVANVFDVLNALRSYVVLIIGGILCFVVWSVLKKVD